MLTEKKIDYLAYSISSKNAPNNDTQKSIPAIFMYKWGYVLDSGERVYTGNVNTDKAYVILSGKALDNMRFEGISIEHYIEEMLSLGAKFSRIDLAMDAFISDDFITVDDYNQYYRDRKIVSSHCKYNGDFPKSIVTSSDSGLSVETTYFGSQKKRGRKGLVRVYDKGIELDIGKYLITRLEVEDKRDKAHVSAQRIASGRTVAEVIKTRFNVMDDKWQSAIDADDIDITRGKQKTDEDEAIESSWQWLFKQVAPRLGELLAIAETEGETMRYEHFVSIVTRAYNDKLNEVSAKE